MNNRNLGRFEISIDILEECKLYKDILNAVFSGVYVLEANFRLDKNAVEYLVTGERFAITPVNEFAPAYECSIYYHIDTKDISVDWWECNGLQNINITNKILEAYKMIEDEQKNGGTKQNGC